MDFLRFLESLRNPVLDVLMQGITYLGEELVFMVLALTVFWCVSKKEGYYLLTVGFFGTLLNQFLKLWFRIPRPWVLDESFTVVESARAGASGYSFPSGHTQNVVGTLGGIARYTRKNGVRVLCIVLAALTAFSRLYLGVHTPLDVGVSVLIAAVLVFALYPVLRRTDEKPWLIYVVLGVMLAAVGAYLLFVLCYRFPDTLDRSNYLSGLKNGYTLCGALLGLLLSRIFDDKKLRFREQAPLPGQICKVVLGLLGIVAIKEGLKLLFGTLFPDELFWNLPRYFCMVVFAGCVWPLSFPWFARLGGGKERA